MKKENKTTKERRGLEGALSRWMTAASTEIFDVPKTTRAAFLWRVREAKKAEKNIRMAEVLDRILRVLGHAESLRTGAGMAAYLAAWDDRPHFFGEET